LWLFNRERKTQFDGVPHLAAKEPVQRQAGDLRCQIEGGDLDRCLGEWKPLTYCRGERLVELLLDVRLDEFGSPDYDEC